jgi:hypothetical protein
MSTVFISYPRSEGEFARGLCAFLEESGVELWVDWQSIRPSEEWLKSILAAIEGSNVVVCVITPDSARSRICDLEVNHAALHSKRLVPLLRGDVAAGDVNEHLRRLHWIHCRDGDDLDGARSGMLSAITTDFNWADEHTRLLKLAINWDRKGRRAADGLRGRALSEAERWLASAGGGQRVAAPLHGPFVRASRRAANRSRLVATATAASLTLAAGLASAFWHWGRVSERQAIMAELQLDSGTSSPLNLTRRPYLAELLRRAENVGSDQAAEIRSRLARIPESSSREAVLPANPDRRGFITAGSGDRNFLWYPDRVESFSVESAAFGLVPVTGSFRVSRGKIIWAVGDPASDGVLFEVEYPHFADSERASKVVAKEGRFFLPDSFNDGSGGTKQEMAELLGYEREFFAATLNGEAPVSLGLSMRLEPLLLADDAWEDVTGKLYFPVEGTPPATREAMLNRGAKDRDLVARSQHVIRKGVDAGGIKVTPLASDGKASGGLYEVEWPDPATNTFEKRLAFRYVQPQLVDGGQLIPLLDPTRYSLAAASTNSSYLKMTTARPNFSPAALDMKNRVAVMRHRLVRFPKSRRVEVQELALDWDRISEVRLLPGEYLLLRHQDRGLALYDVQGRRVVRRFLAPDPRVRSVQSDTTAGFVYLIQEDGALMRWRFDAFGPDGWSAADGTSPPP